MRGRTEARKPVDDNGCAGWLLLNVSKQLTKSGLQLLTAIEESCADFEPFGAAVFEIGAVLFGQRTPGGSRRGVGAKVADRFGHGLPDLWRELPAAGGSDSAKRRLASQDNS